MPLSEEEQRLLEQMEQALAAEDPKFVSALRGSTLRSHNRRRAALAVVCFVLGLALLMTGAILPQTLVSVAGFVVMLASAYAAVTFWRRSNGADAATRRPASTQRGRQPRTKSHGSFMERVEERWRRRRESGF